MAINVSANATVGEVLALTTQALDDAGIPSAEVDAQLFVADALGVPAGTVSTHDPFPQAVAPLVAERTRRRARREPTEYILGRCRFRGLALSVDPRVAIPVEDWVGLLVGAALELSPERRAHDVCTGSGAAALAIKNERPDLVVTGSDISPSAIEVARENARRLQLDVSFSVARDIPPGEYDLVVGNPPYADEAGKAMQLWPEAMLHEPHVAVFGGPDGLNVIRDLVASARTGTRVALGHAPAQAEAVRSLLRNPHTLYDSDGGERLTMGTAP